MRASASEPQQCTVPRIWVIRPCTLIEGHRVRVRVCVCVRAHTCDSVWEAQSILPLWFRVCPSAGLQSELSGEGSGSGAGSRSATESSLLCPVR